MEDQLLNSLIKNPKLWKLLESKTKTLVGHTARWVKPVAFHQNGTRVASSSLDSTIRIWNVQTGHCTTTYKIGGLETACIFNQEGILLVPDSNSENTIRIWDITSRNFLNSKRCSCIKTLYTDFNAKAYAFNYNNTILATGSASNICIWDLKTDECITKLKAHTDAVNSLAFSHDGTQLASGSWDDTIRIWDLSTGNCITTLQTPVRSIVFNHDGTQLASDSYDDTIRIWDTTTGICLLKLKGHTRSVNSLAFNYNGTMLISGSNDNTIRIWDLITGDCISTLTGHTDCVHSVAINHDGTKLASGSSDKTIRIWSIPPSSLQGILDLLVEDYQSNEYEEVNHE